MNAYIHTLSALLSHHRKKFEVAWIKKNAGVVSTYARYMYADVIMKEWLEFSSSESFADVLESCKREALSVARTNGDDISRPTSPELRSVIDDSPFDSVYYPMITFYDDSVIYKPCHVASDADEPTDAYCYLGGKLARTRTAVLPSEWIRAHANDVE